MAAELRGPPRASRTSFGGGHGGGGHGGGGHGAGSSSGGERPGISRRVSVFDLGGGGGSRQAPPLASPPNRGSRAPLPSSMSFPAPSSGGLGSPNGDRSPAKAAGGVAGASHRKGGDRVGGSGGGGRGGGGEDPEMVDLLKNQLEQLAMSKEAEVRELGFDLYYVRAPCFMILKKWLVVRSFPDLSSSCMLLMFRELNLVVLLRELSKILYIFCGLHIFFQLNAKEVELQESRISAERTMVQMMELTNEVNTKQDEVTM